MNENQPKKPLSEREITYRIGRKTGKIAVHEEVQGDVSHKRLANERVSLSSTPFTVNKKSEAWAALLRKTIWREAQQPPTIVLRVGLILFPLICFILVFYLVTTLSNLD